MVVHVKTLMNSLFVTYLFSNAVSSSDYIPLNGRMMIIKWKVVEGSGHGLRYSYKVWVELLNRRKTSANVLSKIWREYRYKLDILPLYPTCLVENYWYQHGATIFSDILMTVINPFPVENISGLTNWGAFMLILKCTVTSQKFMKYWINQFRSRA